MLNKTLIRICFIPITIAKSESVALSAMDNNMYTGGPVKCETKTIKFSNNMMITKYLVINTIIALTSCQFFSG